MATPREKQLTLLAAVLGTSVVFLDATVTSVALPAIRSDLGGGLAGQQWVTNAYLLALASLLLIGGSLGDDGIAYVVVTMRDGLVTEMKGCADRAAAMTYAQTGTVHGCPAGWRSSACLSTPSEWWHRLSSARRSIACRYELARPYAARSSTSRQDSLVADPPRQDSLPVEHRVDDS